MTIDATFLEKFISAVRPGVVHVGGKEYPTIPVFNPPDPVLREFPTLPAVCLCAIPDYLHQNRDDADKAKIQIVVKPTSVAIVGLPSGELRKRDVFIRAEFTKGQAGSINLTDLETVRLSLMTDFVETNARNLVLEFLSHIADERSLVNADDGVSQSVTAHIGIASRAQVTVPSPVILQPIRTFPEVEQPQVPFVFRLKTEPTGMKAALLEQRSNWELQAVAHIKGYLSSQPELIGIPLIG